MDQTMIMLDYSSCLEAMNRDFQSISYAFEILSTTDI